MGDFSLSMDNLLKQVNGNVENVVKKSVFDLTSAIIKGSPVDSGRFRGNYQVSFNKPIDSELDKLDKSGNETISKIGVEINSNKVPMVYWINNNLPYAEKLEYGLYPKTSTTGKTINGFSIQAPSGFVRLNILRFNQFFKQNTKG